MRIILLQDIDKLGKKYDVKEVKDGYARNFLIPKDMAKLANVDNTKKIELEKEKDEKRAEEELVRAQAQARSIDGLEVLIAVKVGEEGQFFESVTEQKIAEALKALGFDVKKSQIALAEPIKELGEFPAKVNFEHNLEAELRVIVTEEK